MEHEYEPTENQLKLEKYLKSIGGLENGYYSNKPPITSHAFFSVSDGWIPLIQNLIEEAIEAGWDKQICQVKEKFGCYDSNTEVLTKFGWKYFKDCLSDDEFATLDNNGFMKYCKSTDIIKYRYSGKMYKLVSRGVDILVTPNHNLYVAKGGWIGKYQKTNVKKHKYGLSIPNTHFKTKKRFKKSFKWKGKTIKNLKIKGYNYSNLHKNGKIRKYKKQSQEYEIKNFLRFLGFYTAEGCADENKGDIRIAICNDGTDKAFNEEKMFKEILIKNNFKIKKSMVDKPAFTFNIYSKVLAKWLVKEVGKGALNKKVPSFIKELTPDLIKIYLNWLFMGDGHKSKTAHTLYTSSKILGDDVCELILKCGQTFRLNKYLPRNSKLISSKNPLYTVRWLKNSNDYEISDKTIKNTKLYVEEYIEYDDFVYCVTVPENKVFIRRNGKGLWCGNSLRFYINSASDQVHEVINKYESLSYEICELCGKEGKLHNDTGWWKTLCEKHHIENEEIKKNKSNYKF